METIQMEIIDLLFMVITTCVGIVSAYVIRYLNKRGILVQLRNNQETVKVVVSAVEQMYKHLSGKERLELAKIELVGLLNEKKINISKKEIDILIESMVKEMNDGVKRELNKTEAL